jgi:hypothetical protein
VNCYSDNPFFGERGREVYAIPTAWAGGANVSAAKLLDAAPFGFKGAVLELSRNERGSRLGLFLLPQNFGKFPASRTLVLRQFYLETKALDGYSQPLYAPSSEDLDPP